MNSFDWPHLDHFVSGAVGLPGQRVFYLQAIANGEVLSFQVEKQQVAVLCSYLERLLLVADLPETTPSHMPELVEPVIAEWTVSSLSVAVNETAGRIVVLIEELLMEDLTEDAPEPVDPDELDGSSARFLLTREQAQAFVDGSRRIIEAGRPLCRLCGRPINPDGHACPRLN